MTMTLHEAMGALEAKGSEQTRATYRRHGASEPLFGVKFGDLRPLAKRIGHDQDLARQLWATGNVDARLLACLVADPTRTTDAELDAWLTDIDSYFLVDTFVAALAAKVPGARARAERWIASDRDRTAQAGWDLLGRPPAIDEYSDEELESKLDLVATHIRGYGNWTRRSASYAITAIGLRDERLEAAARRTASRIGHVEFDPGQTDCVMPDPIAYLEKTKAYRASRAARVGGSGTTGRSAG
jgi:hypothetical protein